MTSQTLVTLKNYFLTGDKPTQGQFANLIDSFLLAADPANAVDFLQCAGAATASPVAYVTLGIRATDTHVGILYQSLGTTTAGSQVYGLVENGTGRHKFQIAGVSALELTDTFWNPNGFYQGPCIAWPVLSNGNLAGGPDAIGGIYSVGATSTTYNKNGTGTATGLSLMFVAFGPSGETHFTGNGGIGHVTISSPQGTNLNGQDEYSTTNSISFSGSFAGSNTSPAIFSAASGDVADTLIGLTYYNYGNGPHLFSLGNLNRSAFQINWANNYVNGIAVTPGASGVNPVLFGFGNAGNIRLSLSGIDDAGVDICNRSGAYPIAKFSAGFAPANWLIFTAGNLPSLSCSGGADLLLTSGSGFVAYGTFVNTPVISAGYIIWHDAAGNARKVMVGT